MTGAPTTLPFGTGRLPLPFDAPFRLDRAPEPAGPPPAASSVADALDRPVGVGSLRESLGGARRAIVAVSDATRATGSATFVPVLLERLAGAGVREVAFAVGSGLHRRPTDEEVARILGDGVAARHEVLLHDPDDPALLDRGTTSAGTPVRLHPALGRDAALVLTGAIGFHYYAGFSGGRKAVVPGLAGRPTIVGNHMRALRRDGSRHPRARAGVLAGNPVHRDMAEAAARLRPAFLLNTVPALDGGIEAAFAGHWRRAHEAGCRHLRASRSIVLEPRPVVVVSAGGAPHDIDLIQAHKAFEAVAACVADGGVVVLVARCPDGHGHEDLRVGLEDLDDDGIVAELRSGYRVYLQTALAWRAKLRRVRLVLVSGLPEDVVRRTGAEPAGDLDQALRLAARTVPAGSAGWVLPHGVRFLVRAGDRREGERR